MGRKRLSPATCIKIRSEDLDRLDKICEGVPLPKGIPSKISWVLDHFQAKIQGESVLEIKSVSQQLSLF